MVFKQLDELFVEIDRQDDGHLVTSLVADESRVGQRHAHDSKTAYASAVLRFDASPYLVTRDALAAGE